MSTRHVRRRIVCQPVSQTLGAGAPTAIRPQSTARPATHVTGVSQLSSKFDLPTFIRLCRNLRTLALRASARSPCSDSADDVSVVRLRHRRCPSKLRLRAMYDDVRHQSRSPSPLFFAFLFLVSTFHILFKSTDMLVTAMGLAGKEWQMAVASGDEENSGNFSLVGFVICVLYCIVIYV